MKSQSITLPFIYEPGKVLVSKEIPNMGFFATHWVSAKMEIPGQQPSFHYCFTKVGFIAPETPVEQCTILFQSQVNAFSEGDRVCFLNIEKNEGTV
jgi:hypothetical protein